MKSFKFSLQNILGINETIKRTYEIESAEVNRLLRSEELALEEINLKIRKALTLCHKKEENISPSYFLQREKYLCHLEKLRQNQKKIVSVAAEDAERALNKLIKAEIEVKKIERTRKREQKQWTYEINKEEQKINDEISSSAAYLNSI